MSGGAVETRKMKKRLYVHKRSKKKKKHTQTTTKQTEQQREKHEKKTKNDITVTHHIQKIVKKFVFNFMLFIRFLVLGKFKQYHGLDFAKTSKLNVLHSFASVFAARIQQKNKNKSIGHKTLHLQMIKIERQEPVTKQTNEWTTNMKKRTQIKQQPISGCVHGRGKTKTQNQETNKQSRKKNAYTHKSEYGNSMGICQRSLSKTHIKWSNLYPWKLAREHHYQQHIDIHQHDDDRLVQVSALNCPTNALIQKKYPAHKN